VILFFLDFLLFAIANHLNSQRLCGVAKRIPKNHGSAILFAQLRVAWREECQPMPANRRALYQSASYPLYAAPASHSVSPSAHGPEPIWRNGFARENWARRQSKYLKLSRDEQARRIVELYNSLKSATERQAVTIDYLIIAAAADVHHVWGVIQEEVSRRSEIETCLLVARHALDVTRKIVERAKTPEGYKDRELFMRLESSLDSRVDSLVRRLCETQGPTRATSQAIETGP
jgi:hypothetical protein